MKNILKKIGLIAIIVGVLSPFISLPSVKAQNDGCDHYLNQYLFLDYMQGRELLAYYQSGHKNFATFLYTFADTSSTNLTTTIVDAKGFLLENEDDIDKFYQNYILLVDDERDEDSRSDNLETFGNWASYNENDRVETSIIHGYWGVDDDDNDTKRAEWEEVLTGADKLNTSTKFYNATIQKLFLEDLDEEVEGILFEEYGGATLSKLSNSGNFGAASGYSKDLESFLNKIIIDSQDENSTSYSKNYLLKNKTNELFFNATIERTIESDQIEGFTYGYVDADGTYKIISSDKESYSGTKSYDGTMKYIENFKEAKDNGTLSSSGDNVLNYCKETEDCYIINTTASQIDIMLFETLYWPAVYEVEYKTCGNVSNTPSNQKSWTLTYDKGVSGDEAVKVQNMPNSVSNITTTTYTLSSTKPEREGYEFKSWCTDKDGKGTCVEAGKEFKNEKMEDDILYAYWVKPGTENNEKQGVMSYVFGFIGVGLIAYGLYYVINKKNLFKQI